MNIARQETNRRSSSAVSEFSRSLTLTTGSLQQDGMSLAEPSIRKWQCLQRGDRLIHGGHIIAHLAPIVAFLGFDFLRIFLQRFIHLRLRALDPAGGLGLLDHVHLDVAINVRNDQ